MASTGDIGTTQSWNKCYVDYQATRRANGTNPYWYIEMWGYIKHTGSYGTTYGSGTVSESCHGQSNSHATSINVGAGSTQHLISSGFTVHGTGAPSLGLGFNLSTNVVNCSYGWGMTMPNIPVTTITYNGNADGVTGVPGNQVKYWGAALAITTAKPVRGGYEFLGWGTSSSTTTISYGPGAAYTPDPGGTVTLYAIWKVMGSVKLEFLGKNVKIDSMMNSGFSIGVSPITANIINDIGVLFYYSIVPLDDNGELDMDKAEFVACPSTQSQLTIQFSNNFLKEEFYSKRNSKGTIKVGIVTTTDKTTLADEVTNKYIIELETGYTTPVVEDVVCGRVEGVLDISFTGGYSKDISLGSVSLNSVDYDRIKDGLQVLLNKRNIVDEMYEISRVAGNKINFKLNTRLPEGITGILDISINDTYFRSNNIVTYIPSKIGCDVSIYKDLLLEVIEFVEVEESEAGFIDGILYAKNFVQIEEETLTLEENISEGEYLFGPNDILFGNNGVVYAFNFEEEEI